MKEEKIAYEFIQQGSPFKVRPLGEGNINDTYLVTYRDKTDKFVLQRINPRVFPETTLIMANLRLLHNHLAQKGSSALEIIPAVMTDKSGSDYFLDEEGATWRALTFIENSIPPKKIPASRQVREAGRLLATFHSLTADLPVDLIKNPLPNLHNTPSYLRDYDKIGTDLSRGKRSGDFRYCADFIDSRRSLATILREAEEEGVLRQRVIHGDPKLDNFLLDRASGRGLSLIDLDTVKPGLLLHDLGDFLRSCCNQGGEDPLSLNDISFDIDLFKAAMKGYLEGGKGNLQKNDLFYLYEVIRLIPYELGLRFFTDYLQGNIYFKILDPMQNLRRALAQFRLTENIEEKEWLIKSEIEAAL